MTWCRTAVVGERREPGIERGRRTDLVVLTLEGYVVVAGYPDKTVVKCNRNRRIRKQVGPAKRSAVTSDRAAEEAAKTLFGLTKRERPKR